MARLLNPFNRDARSQYYTIVLDYRFRSPDLAENKTCREDSVSYENSSKTNDYNITYGRVYIFYTNNARNLQQYTLKPM